MVDVLKGNSTEALPRNACLLEDWTKIIQHSETSELQEGLSPEDALIVFCGVMHLGEGKACYHRVSLVAQTEATGVNRASLNSIHPAALI